MIIFLNGSINSGKSTLAKILAERIPNTAHIEVDNLREFVSFMPLDESIPINLENTVLLIKNFVKNGLNIIVTYPLSQKNYEFFKEELKDLKDKIYFFTLNPKIEKISNNDRGRDLSDWEKERIKYHYKIGINNPSFGTVIDNTDKTPEETAEEILELLK